MHTQAYSLYLFYPITGGVMTVYQLINDIIIKKLESGVIPWKPTWRIRTPMNYISKRPYSGINQLLLSCNTYDSPYYLTFNQVKNLGGKVVEGEKGHIVTFMYEPEAEDNLGSNTQQKKYSNVHLRYYKIWNIEQTTLEVKDDDFGNDNIPLLECSKIINGYHFAPDIIHQDTDPVYNKKRDEVRLPEMNKFENSESYYAALFHELTHSTGHASRLNRKSLTDPSFFGSEKYGQEELVAEVGAFMLCSKAQISTQTADNSIGYIQGWLEILKHDKSLLFSASKYAQDAFTYIIGNGIAKVEQVA